jgi:hypothetical protein
LHVDYYVAFASLRAEPEGRGSVLQCTEQMFDETEIFYADCSRITACRWPRCQACGIPPRSAHTDFWRGI